MNVSRHLAETPIVDSLDSDRWKNIQKWRVFTASATLPAYVYLSAAVQGSMLEKLKDNQSIVIARILRIGFHIASVRLTKHGGTAVLLGKRRGFRVTTVEVNESGLCKGVSFSEWIETG